MLPDTQVYSLRFPGMFLLQTAWLAQQLEARDLQLVVWNGDPSRGAMKPLWRGLRMGSQKS